MEVAAHEMREQGGREGGCAAHWKLPAMAPTPMAMDVAEEGREDHLRCHGGHIEKEGGKDGAARWKSLPSPSSSCDMEVGGREEGRKGEGTSELDLTVPPSW